MEIPESFPVPENEDPFLRVVQLQVYAESTIELVLANEMLARVQALLSIQKINSILRCIEVQDALSEEFDDEEEDAEVGEDEAE